MSLRLLLPFLMMPAMAAALPVDTTAYHADCGVLVKTEGEVIRIAWNAGNECVLDLAHGKPLIQSLAAKGKTILRALDPMLSMTVGTRVAPSGRPPTMSPWNVFFDNPHKRPHETYLGDFKKQAATVSSEGRRATVSVSEVVAGPFRGAFSFTFFADSPLIKMEAVVTTQEDLKAYIFDLGLVGNDAGWQRFIWTDVHGVDKTWPVDSAARDENFRVRHRLIGMDGEAGSVALFPPPHQFFFPVDSTDNSKFFWRGRGHQGLERFGVGIRQDKTGGGNFVPWFNGPPGTQQRPSFFLLLNEGKAEVAITDALRYTRSDRFAEIPGMSTYSSHYHMAIAMTAKEQIDKGVNRLPVPELVQMFKAMNVQSVHLGEFHGDGHPQDPGPLRLPELKLMFDQCARLSDDDLLLIPGEEANQHLGIPFPGRHPGHWMLLFPKPVYWTMRRAEGQPLVEDVPGYGTVYHTGNREDMVEVIKREQGLAWTAHARIKASSWTPDIFKDEAFFKDKLWLGAAWKSMPADLSRERLGERCLNLLDDMCNWGARKYLPGEVDVFKIDHTHELYGHMNINYLRLPDLPRYQDGWQPVLHALSSGAFFTTTGEILIKAFTVGGKQSGETLQAQAHPEVSVTVELEWTFPMKFAEVISGDGEKVYRERIEMTDTDSFGARTLVLKPKLQGRKWVRLEAWDAAANGAYTQPVWLE